MNQSAASAPGRVAGELEQVEPALIEAAAAWMARLWADDVSNQDRAACQRWRDADPMHERAWQCVCEISGKFSQLPKSSNASRVLESAHQSALSRRQFLQWTGAGILTAMAGAYGLNRNGGWQAALAQYQTAVGETQQIDLADGTQLILNTNTAVDVEFTAGLRRILLYRGELWISTGRETPRRDFVVDTDYGRLTAVGTKFTVRQDAHYANVAVLEGAVQIDAAQGGQSRRLDAGQQATVDGSAIGLPQEVGAGSGRWRDGLLVAERMRVADFVAELARYRRGFVFCDDAVANLEVTGVFSTRDTDRALKNLAQSLPVALRYRAGYWVKVVPR